MCIKSSCTKCHSKSHCQEFSKNKQIAKLERTIGHMSRRIEEINTDNDEVMDELLSEIEEYKKLTESLLKEVEESTKLLEIAGEKIEKMKTCDNCKHNWREYGGENSCELTWTAKRCCTRKLNFSNNFEDFWELG